MATYRYYGADILTGSVFADLPMLQVSMGRQLSAAGTFNGSLFLGSDRYSLADLITGTEPGRVAMLCERDDTLIWAGPIWTRGYDSSQRRLAIGASTWESLFDRTVIETDFIQQQVDQLTIFKNLIDLIQLQSNNNYGFDTSGIGTSGVLRDSLVPGYEYHFAQEVVSQLVAADDAFDFMIQPNKQVVTGYPQIIQGGKKLYYDFPGNVMGYTWNESASNGGTKFAVLGNGSGSSMLRAEAYAQSLLDSGYPALWKVLAKKSAVTTDEVARLVGAARDKYALPAGSPTFTLKPDQVPYFDAWDALGTQLQVHIEDVRFPAGVDVTSRMIGWSLQPSGGDQGVEKLTLTMESLDA